MIEKTFPQRALHKNQIRRSIQLRPLRRAVSGSFFLLFPLSAFLPNIAAVRIVFHVVLLSDVRRVARILPASSDAMRHAGLAVEEFFQSGSPSLLSSQGRVFCFPEVTS